MDSSKECKKGSQHLNPYFAGVCDGSNGEATALCEKGRIKTASVTGTLVVELVPASDGEGRTVRLGEIDSVSANDFAQKLTENCTKGWIWITAANSKGSSITIQAKNISMVYFLAVG